MSQKFRTIGSDNDDYRQHGEPSTSDVLQLALWEEQTVVVIEGQVGITWEEATTAFLRTLDSPNTRRSYARHLRNAAEAMDVVCMDEVTGARLSDYRALVTAAELAPASQGHALAAVRSFMAWSAHLAVHSITSKVVEIALRTPRGSVQTRYSILTEPEIVGLLEAASTTRDRAILGVLLGAGLRVAEASALQLEDITEDSDGHLAIFVNQGKGRKDRHVPIQDDVGALLRAYVGESRRYFGSDGPLFLATDRGSRSRKKAGLSVRGLARVVEICAARAQIAVKRVSPHSLRHTYAVRALRAGGNVVAVSKLLGHASITTTQRYVDHLAVSELRATVPPLPVRESGVRELAS